MSQTPGLPHDFSTRRRRHCDCNGCDFESVILFCIAGGALLMMIFYTADMTSSFITSSISSTVPKFHVNDVSLTEFTLSPTNNTLYYNLAVNMTFRNPSKRVRIYYKKIEGNPEYHGNRFGMAEIQGFYLGHKKENSNVRMVFKGEELVVFDGDHKAKYDSETKDGDHVYSIDLKLRLKMSFKPLLRKTNSIFQCPLKVPLSSPQGRVSSSAKFERTKCSFKKELYYYDD